MKTKRIQSIILVAALTATVVPVNVNAVVKEENFVRVGDFLISEEEGYSYDEGVLSIFDDGEYTIEMVDDVESTSDTIRVDKGVNADINFGDISIDKTTDLGGAAIVIDDATVSFNIIDDAVVKLATGVGPGLVVSDDSTLTVGGNGVLDVEVVAGAAIGGNPYDTGDFGELVINNGTINAESNLRGVGIGGSYTIDSSEAGNGGNVIVNDGTVNIKVSDGVAIGGMSTDDDYADAGDGGKLTVNGGTINAEVNTGTAIGGGYSLNGSAGDGAEIIINGGCVDAKNVLCGGAIGGGYSQSGNGGNGGSLVVNGGEFTADAFVGATIGGGISTGGLPGNGVEVEVNDGKVKVTNKFGCAIGAGVFTDSEGNSYPNTNNASFTINGGKVETYSSNGVALACADITVCGGEFEAKSDKNVAFYSEDDKNIELKINPGEDKKIVFEVGVGEGKAEYEGSPFETEYSETGKFENGYCHFVEEDKSTSSGETGGVELKTTAAATVGETTTVNETTIANETTAVVTTTNNVETTKKSSEKTVVSPTKITKLKAKKKAVFVKWKKVKKIAGYQIQYSTKKKFGKAKTVNVKKNKTSITIKKLKKNKRYYVRIRTYILQGEERKYSDWSAAKYKKIK
ncbi:MAG: fibronectin type III domain-containing protein [Lachnospiraceae bacterium]|nr:fibronectin type III domain-containing protein [Lachnospiraceae bacterium]